LVTAVCTALVVSLRSVMVTPGRNAAAHPDEPLMLPPRLLRGGGSRLQHDQGEDAEQAYSRYR
jgi:hypothetical protein